MTIKEFFKKESERKISMDFLEIQLNKVFGKKIITILEDKNIPEYLTIKEEVDYNEQDIFDYEDACMLIEEYAKTIAKILELPEKSFTVKSAGREMFEIKYFYKI